MILEFAHPLNFVFANTWFKKDEGRLMTYEICRTVVVNILITKRERNLISDV